MNPGSQLARSIGVAVLFGLAIVPASSGKNLVDEEHQIYMAQPIITEPAWTQTGVYLKSFLFDLPNAESRPSPQVGFVFTPGFTWSILNILELNVGFPLVLNPDGTGDQELNQANAARAADPNYVDPPNWDGTPDFDLPGIQIGLKGRILGSKPKDGLFLAIGVRTHIPIEKWATNYTPQKTALNHSSSFHIDPYISVGYAIGRFSPQAQVGMSIRMKEDVYNEDTSEITTKGFTDIFFNLALPFAFAYEGTVPMLELNGVYNPDEGTQLFITPAVTFLPMNSPASLGFACMIPIHDSSFRNNEGFRFVVNFSYQFEALSIPGFDDEEESDGTSSESPPAGW
ncbi:MAG: hypothetical protein JRJ87_17190 [Deltaproteobacteria bacterium]|nr:hypothetical protein [Deltaproteobacteria bacterium]